MPEKKLKEKKITITIDRKIWRRMSDLKMDKSFRSFDEVLNFLFKNQKK